LNPDVELPTHLSERGFEHAPAAVATLQVDLPGESEPATVMVVHEAVEHQSDLWVRVLDDLSLRIDDTVLFADASEVAADEPASPIAALVGRRTAELHHALAGADGGAALDASMRPDPFNLQWQRSIVQVVRGSVRSTQRELKRHLRTGDLGDRGRELAAVVIDRGDELITRFDRLATDRLRASRIRIHGDLHLGQILWTGHDIVFIDFEGEPGQPIGQRRIKRSPLGDVAGLLRSFDYAGRVAVDTMVERGRVAGNDVEALERFRRQWTERSQQEMLAAYRDGMADTDLIPDDDDDLTLLLDVYVTTKALYEVRYELANRPAWAAWPMSSLVELLDRRP
jgi:maltose alpha-D-glucosyltransferase/alpha-amylase